MHLGDKITPAGGRTTLYSFCTLTNCPAEEPVAGLVQDGNGNFYGTAALVASATGVLFSKSPRRISGPRFYSFWALTNCAKGGAATSSAMFTVNQLQPAEAWTWGWLRAQMPLQRVPGASTFTWCFRPRARSIPWVQATFAIQTGEECVSAFQQFHHFRVPAMRQGPTAATCKKAAFIGEIGNAPAIHDTVKANDSMLQSIPEQMIENVFRQFLIAADLHDLAHRSRLHVIDVPTRDFLILIAEHNLAQGTAGGPAPHESQKPPE